MLRRAVLGAGVVAAAIVATLLLTSRESGDVDADLAAQAITAQMLATATPTATPVPSATPTATPTVTPIPFIPSPTPLPTSTPTWVSPDAAQPEWKGEVPGVLTFRGSPMRSYHGVGPVPSDPQVTWSYPEARTMCGASTVGEETSQWCGLGWTGQPAVWERDGGVWVAFGAYDYGVHVLDGVTGDARFPPFRTGDIIKGSVTVDPDGLPLIYTGSRDNFLRILSWDRGELVELWALDAQSITPRRWNDDWDGSPLILDDYLFEGGENSNLHIVKLNRAIGEDGLVTVDPEVIFTAPGWDDELTSRIGSNVSIEGSVAVYESTLWFANSGGLVQGWDIHGLKDGEQPERIFRFWMGDDVDASIVVDDEGFLYAAAEYERGTARAREVGQLVKLDPDAPDDPVVWSFADTQVIDSGIWATPAVTETMVYTSTNGGRLLGLSRATGEVIWEKRLPGPLWSSQVVVDDVLLQGDCGGTLHAFDIADPLVDPDRLWSVPIGGCIEATPVVWSGRIFLGTRGGQFHMLTDPT